MQGNERRGPGPRLPPVDRWMPLLCSFILAAAWGQMNFTGDQVLRILAKDEKQLSLFRDLENLKTQKLDFWRGPARPSLPVDMRVSFPELDDIRAYLESHGLVYSIMIKNIQELLDKEREAMVKACRLECSTSSFSYSSYHTLEEIYSWIDNFVTEHSDIISKIHISNSFENQSILVLKIVSEYGKDRVLTDILKVMDVFIELVTNPDGFAFTHSMTQPRNDTSFLLIFIGQKWSHDLNQIAREAGKHQGTYGYFMRTVCATPRNFNPLSGFILLLGNGSNSSSCSETYHRLLPQSEPEVATIVDFVTGHGNFKALISIHSYSQMLMYPYGHSVEPISNQKELYSLAKDAVKALYKVHRSKYIFGSISTTLYVASGVTVDWAYDSGIKYAFTFELRDTGCYGFLLPAAQIIPMAQETWVAMRTIMEHTLNHPY